MPSVAGVTLNQPQSGGGQDPEIERFVQLYESQSTRGSAATFQDVPLPAVRSPAEVAPRLDITTQAKGDDTLVTAELTKPVTNANGTTTLVTKQTSILLNDINALAVTQGLSEVLDATSEQVTQAVSKDALAARLYEDLARLLEDLGDLFGDLDLVLFDPLPDANDLPTLDQYEFSDPYMERFWQLTWATWSGERAYDTEMMIGLGLRSSAVTAFGIDFTRRIVDGVKSPDGTNND